MTEINAGVNPTGSTNASQYEVALYDWIKKKQSADADGTLGERRAWALMGDNQLKEALTQANEVFNLRSSDVNFCYNYACLMSRINNTDKALAFLENAMSQGYCNIAHVKVDYDLENLRRDRKAEFDKLIAVNALWDIKWGVINDDVTLINNSAFPITNVKFSCHFEHDATVWDRELIAEVIRPGETKVWSNTMSVPGRRLTKKAVTLSCDQNR